jgi:hypothetical protein
MKSRKRPAWGLAAALAIVVLSSAAWQNAPKYPFESPIKGRASVTETPEKDGVSVRNPLDKSLHLKNVGGSDGYGLCVFASISHTGRWQCIPGLSDFMDWMRSRPGGGYPEKVDQMIEQKLGSASGLNYIHAYGLAAMPLLEKACASGRMPGVTYGYGERYGVSIDHMVSLAHLDKEWACILDNNFPGTWEWMPRAEFEERFEWTTRGKQQGWAVIVIDNPQPPTPIR